MFNCKSRGRKITKVLPNKDQESGRPSDLNGNDMTVRTNQDMTVRTDQDMNQSARAMLGDVELTQEFETKYLNPECYEKV